MLTGSTCSGPLRSVPEQRDTNAAEHGCSYLGVGDMSPKSHHFSYVPRHELHTPEAISIEYKSVTHTIEVVCRYLATRKPCVLACHPGGALIPVVQFEILSR